MSALAYSVAHQLKNRVRLKAPLLRRSPEKAYLVEITLRKLPGVTQVEASPRSTGILVVFDAETLTRQELLDYIDELIAHLPDQEMAAAPRVKGKPRAVQEAHEIVCAIEGMSCHSCSQLVEMALNRLDNVAKARVKFASKTATIRGTASREEIFAAIEKAGYTPRPLDTVSQRALLVERDKELVKKAKRRFLLALTLAAPVVVAGMSMSMAMAPRLISFVFTTPLVFGVGRPFFSKAWQLAKQGQTNMDTLIALGSGSAYVYSIFALAARPRMHYRQTAAGLVPVVMRRALYFESAASIITLILLGKYLEERAKGKASEAISKLVELQPLTANVIREGVESCIGIDEVLVDDEVIVRPGDRVPVDGVVSQGRTTVDESLVTGESLPVAKQAEDQVTGGTINLSGTVRFRVTAVGGDTVLAGIIRLVDQAQSSRVPVQRLADKISSVFVPAVMGVSALTFAGWTLAGFPLARAFMNSISVLLISCPCSMGLATPTAVMAGTGSAAREGIFIRNAEGLERAGKIDVLVLDKTGTITEGRPAVTDFHNLSELPDGRLLELAAAAEHDSEHFVGKAIVDYAAQQGAEALPSERFEALIGLGIKAEVAGSRLTIGNELLMQQEGVPTEAFSVWTEQLSQAGKTPVYFAIDGRPGGIMAVADRPRATSREAIGQLKALGVRAVILTGDNARTGRYVADQVGVEEVVAGATPAMKVAMIKELKAAGATVGMVGDGVNDAPSLAEADVGFAVGTGADIAMEASHITLINGDISKVVTAIALSRKTMVIIRENLFWALGYNTLAIPLAAAGALTPTIASGAMAFSSVSVVTNSLRLQRRSVRQRAIHPSIERQTVKTSKSTD